jgi:iron complex outermembrane recepter protein
MHAVRFRSIPILFSFALAMPCTGVAAGGEGEDILDEVIVTGTLRAGNLAAVPASVTVLGEGTLKEAGVQHFEDVLGLVPNLNWAAGSSRPRYFQIRGIGEREQYEGAPNPSVGFLIDDIDFSGLGMPATLFDLQQIEVLRGPQGTQYGANALAGLIVVRSKDPEPDAGYSLEASGGDFGTRSVGVTATGPVEALSSAWRLSVQKYESDGFMHNDYLDRDTNGRDELTARFKWHAQAGEGTALDFTFLHADLDNGYDAWSLDNSRRSLSDEPGVDHQRANAGSLRLTSEMAGSNVLTAVGSYARSATEYGYDYDWGNPDSWAPLSYEGTENWDRVRRVGSLELRLASPAATAGGDMAWLAGAYGLRMNESGRYTSNGAFFDPAGDPDWNWTDDRLLDDRYHATNLALFGQLDGYLAGHWRWSGGLRFEQRRARYRDSGEVNGDAAASDLRARNRMWGGQLSLSTDLTDAATGYAVLSRGYKAGGFNLGDWPDELRSFNPEYLWNLETGLKTKLADGRGHAEVAVFYQRRKDQQVRSGRQLAGGGPYEFVTINLSRGYSTGMEANLTWELTRGLQVGASLGLLRTRSGATVNEDGDPVASRENAHAPEYTAAVNATWRHAGGFFARVDVTAMDDFYFDVPTDHDQKSQPYSLTNLKLGYEHRNWSVYGWLRNAFDKQYAVRGFYFGNDPSIGWEPRLYQQYGDPRQFGLTAALSF